LLSSPDHGFLFSELYHRPQVGSSQLAEMDEQVNTGNNGEHYYAGKR